MMRPGLSLLVLAILGVACGEEENPLAMCDMQAIMACKNPQIESAFRRDVFYPDEAFLKEHCDDIVQMIDCLLEEEKTCPLSVLLLDGGERFRGLIGLKHLVGDLCDETSSLRKDYIDSRECLDAHMDDFGVAVNQADEIVKKFKVHHDLADPEIIETRDALSCLHVAFGLSEMQKSIEKYCGTVARNTIHTMLHHVLFMEPDYCVANANVRLYTEMLESFRSEEGSVAINSVE